MRLCGNDSLISLALVTGLTILVQSCSILEKTPGIGKHEWLFSSGEIAQERHPAEIRTPETVGKALTDKLLKGESLTGRECVIYRGASINGRESSYGKLLQRRPSNSKNFDEEWEYDCWVVYSWRGRVKDVQFKDIPDEPQPVLKRSIDFIPK